MPEEAAVVTETLEGRVLTVTLNRPQRRNTITTELIEVLQAILGRAASDPEVRVLVLTGAGATFCAGGDVGGMDGGNAATPARPVEMRDLLAGANTSLLLHRMPKPTIAMIRGAAAGGGLALAAACDLRLSADTARFTFAYTRLGLAGDFAATYLLEKLLGTTRAREFCLLCPVVGAEEALKIGLVTRVFAEADLESETYGLARQLASFPPHALGRIKANLDAAAELSPDEAVEREAETFLECLRTPDHREAVQAFLEKRGRPS